MAFELVQTQGQSTMVDATTGRHLPRRSQDQWVEGYHPAKTMVQASGPRSKAWTLPIEAERSVLHRHEDLWQAISFLRAAIQAVLISRGEETELKQI